MKASAGLSIEDSVIRVSITEGKRVLRTEDIELPASEEERTALLRDSLLRWKKEDGVEGVVLGIDFKNFTHHFVELPLHTRKDIRNALPFEMERHLPLPLQEYLFDFIVVERNGKNSKCLVLSTKRDKLEWAFRSLGDTGLRLAGVRCTIVEALNELVSTIRPDSAIFVQPSGGGFNIAGLKETLPAFFRAAKDEAEAAAEVERLKETFGGVLLSSAPVRFAEGVRDMGYRLSTIAALSAFKKRPLALDFTPSEFLPKEINYYHYVIGAMSAASVLLYLMTSLLAYGKDRAALKEIETKLAGIKASASGLIVMRNAIDEAEKHGELLLELKRKGRMNIEALRRLSSTLPDDAWLTAFSADEKGFLRVEGYAKSTARIMAELEKSPSFKNIEIIAPVAVRSDMEKFSIRMEVEK